MASLARMIGRFLRWQRWLRSGSSAARRMFPYDDVPWWTDKYLSTKWIPAEEFRQVWRRKASLAHTRDEMLDGEGGLTPSSPESLLKSWLGDVLLARPGEGWPYRGEQPLMPFYQFNLSELPYCPPQLSDLFMITIFIDPDEIPIHTLNGDGWLVRAYKHGDDLIPLQRPAILTSESWDVKPVHITWSLTEDFPNLDYGPGGTLPIIEECTSWSDYVDLYNDCFPNATGAKIGGFAYTIQNKVSWDEGYFYSDGIRVAAPPGLEFVIQSDCEEGFSWGDAGIAFFGRDTKENYDLWMLDWQCL